MFDRVRQEIRRRRRGNQACAVCGRPILLEHEIRRFHGKPHHVECVEYKRRRSRPSADSG